MQLDKVLLDQC